MADAPNVVSPEMGQGPTDPNAMAHDPRLAQMPAPEAQAAPPAAQAAPDVNAPVPGSAGTRASRDATTISCATDSGWWWSTTTTPGSMFSHLSHAFMGAVLGSLAGKTDTTGYTTNEQGDLSPVQKTLTPRDQLAKIAKGALQGLAAVGQYGLAAPAVQIEKSHIHTQQMKQEATDQFEREQKEKFSQLNNTHIMLETLGMRKDLANADLKSNQDSAGLGSSIMEAAVAGGNQIIGKPNMDSSEATQFRKDNPDYLKYTPLVTRAVLETNPDGTPVIDPNTGIQKVQRSYTFVDLQKPISLTGEMIDHLKAMNIPGADRLTTETKVDPLTFQSLYWNGLKAYNEANNDSKNNEVVETTDAQGNPTKTLVNKVTKVVTPLIDPETHQPLNGALKTELHTEYNPATQKNEDYIINSRNGQKIKYVGENKSDMNSLSNTIGDFTKTGDAYLQTVPPALRGIIKSVAGYTLAPADLGRSNNRMQVLEAAGQYNGGELDERNYKLRYNYLNEYQDAKAGEGKIRSASNIAISHLDYAANAGQYLAQNNLQGLNSIANAMGLATGASAPAVYDAIAYKAASEAAAAVKGGIPDAAEIDKIYSQFNSKASPSQRNGVINAQFALLVPALQNLRTRFTEAMGQTPESLGRPLLNDNNEKILQKHGFGSIAAPPAAAAGGAPAPLTNLHSDGKTTIGWDGKQWVDSTNRQPYIQGAK